MTILLSRSKPLDVIIIGAGVIGTSIALGLSLPGFYMAVGISGNPFKNAPVIGALMTRLITVCESGQDHDDDPVMFHLPALKRTISLGFFSRNRALHSKTSGTVLA